MKTPIKKAVFDMRNKMRVKNLSVGSPAPAPIVQAYHRPLSIWLDDLNEQDQAYFTSSAKGWTCDALGIA
jgi:hypothetical protein